MMVRMNAMAELGSSLTGELTEAIGAELRVATSLVRVMRMEEVANETD